MALEPYGVGLIVSSMAGSLAFYRKLGLVFPEGAENEPHVEYVTPTGFRLMWDTVDVIHAFHPEWREREGGRVAIGFRCDTAAEVDAKYAEMVEAGYHGELPPFDAFWGQRYATLHDPDGNGIDLFH